MTASSSTGTSDKETKEAEEGDETNSGKWICYNDNVVTPLNSKDVSSASAYVLFYRRRDLAGNHKHYPHISHIRMTGT